MLHDKIVSKYNRTHPIADINVVPYIDVMLVLLVIFMITAPLLTQGVEVDLPEIQSQIIQDSDQEPLVVSVDANGQYFLNAANQPDEPISPQALFNRISAELQIAQNSGYQRRVLVRGDQHVDYGNVVSLMVLLQQAGVPNVGLITQQPPEQARSLAGTLLPDVLES